MSQYYKPNRKPDYNYGGPKWTLSRSKIDLFLDCQRCFYLDNKLGVARPPGFPFNLNSAVDALLKKELDAHRAKGTQHPLAKAYGLDAVPLAHEKMDEWRDALRHGVQWLHKETGLLVRGGVDDIWVTPDGELIVIDYKATSKDGRIESLDEEWHKGYKRQLEVYQWLLRQNGFKVSDMGYWFYANATKDREAFDGKLDFELTLVPYKGSTDWVEGTLLALKKCLDSGEIPPAGADCDYCRYRESAGKALWAAQNAEKEKPAVPEPKKLAKKEKGHEEEQTTPQLF
ncbi:MAG TPA: PD-(D/E)XK nuclease family protein [Candidatus Paceibacterota bacterium]|nr:PD-(D/E)XK nuclease family protein [Candidatus Paceibacterota bacterium]